MSFIIMLTVLLVLIAVAIVYLVVSIVNIVSTVVLAVVFGSSVAIGYLAFAVGFLSTMVLYYFIGEKYIITILGTSFLIGFVFWLWLMKILFMRIMSWMKTVKVILT